MKLTLWTAMMLAGASLSRADVLQVADFETGDTSQLSTQAARDDSLTIVEFPVRAGKYAVRTELRSTDPAVHRGNRAEFSDSPKLSKIEMEKDYWYGLSIYVPKEFEAPTKSSAVLFQWHTQQGGPSPVLAIRIRRTDWIVTTDTAEKRRTLANVPLTKDRWTDWVVHVRWSAEQQGYWTIWKDGKEVVSEEGVVTQLRESLGPYAKFGQYHSVEYTPRNVVYFDEYRVAGPGGSYETVAPAQGHILKK